MNQLKVLRGDLKTYQIIKFKQMGDEKDVLAKKAGSLRQQIKSICSKTNIPLLYIYKITNNEFLENEILILMREKIINFYVERLPTQESCIDILSELKNNKKLINYDKNTFNHIKTKYSPKFDILLNEINIVQFRIGRKYFDIDGFIEFCKYLISIGEEFIELLKHSSSGDGLLTEMDFEQYLRDAFTRMDYFKKHLGEDLNSEKYPFYFCYIKDKLYNQVDYLARSKISATSIVSSPNLTLFLLLNDIYDNNLSIEQFDMVYNSFANNVNEDGFLNEEGVNVCYNNCLNPAFISRFFELTNCYNNCLDFYGYTRFINIYQHIESRIYDDSVLRFLFRMFDVSNTGTIDPHDILFFYNGALLSSKADHFGFDVFLQEILDRTGCHGKHISLDLFLNCGVAHDISLIFSNISKFSQIVPLED